MKNCIQYKAFFAAYSVFFAIASNISAQTVDPPQNIPDNTTVSWAPVLYPGIHDLYGDGNYNYIRTIVPDQPIQSLTGTGAYFKRQSTAFFDGLGRPLQTVVKKGNAGGNDIVNVSVYDDLGRQTYQYLPYAAPTSGLYFYGYGAGSIKLKDSTQMRGFYEQAGNDEQPYGKTIFDNSPLNRVVKQIPPGRSWAGGPNGGRGVSYEYKTNADQQYNHSSSAIFKTNGNYPRFSIGSGIGAIPQYVGNYDIGQLFVTKATDEDGKISEEVKDKSGKLIMKRVKFQNLSENNFPANAATDIFPSNYTYTYYIYDSKGQLRVVIPPAAIIPIMSSYSQTFGTPDVTTYSYDSWQAPTQTQMDGLCYQYYYDNKGRLAQKKVPGKEVEYFAYDKKDRQIFYQDGILRKEGKWAFTFYDGLNRITATGISQIDDGVYTLPDLQTLLNSGITNGLAYYFNRFDLYHEYPSSGSYTQVLSYTYYDDYSQGDLSNFAYDYTQFDGITALTSRIVSPQDHASVMIRGKSTGTKVRVLDPESIVEKWLTSVTFYDDKGRTIQTQSQNINDGLDISSNIYFFQGMLYKNILNHQNPSAAKIPTPDFSGNIDYLPEYRLENTFERNLTINGGNDLVWKHTQKINAGIDYELAFYGYDHLGRNVYKEYSSGRHYQNYSIRGFLSSLAFDSYNLDTVFNENLYYDRGFESKLYNGNIAGITWCGADRGQYRSYGYSYDELNRLTHAQFNQKDGSNWTNIDYDFTVSELSYDLNGNIQRMVQTAPQTNTAPIEMDNLFYKYNENSNQLFNVRDEGSTDLNLLDFKDNANHGSDYIEEYVYDENGNLTRDDNKLITSITYNHLNKPTVITLDTKGSITYVYDATGNKLQKRIVDFNNSTKNETWDYIGNFIYKNNVLQYILNEEGRARPVAIEIENTTPSEFVTKFVYDYFIKDHVGNVRSTITSKPIDAMYLASYELVAANTEELVFDNIANVREVKGGGTPDDAYAARLNGGESDHRVGTAIILRTKPGDKFRFNVKAFYDGEYTQTDEISSQTMLESLVSTLMGGTTPNGTPFSESGSGEMVQSMLGNSGLASALEDLTTANNNPNAPKAHLNYLWFDDHMRLDPSHSGSYQVLMNTSGVGGWLNIGTGTNGDGLGTAPDDRVHITGNGLLLVYIDNQSIGKNVWFDNLNVENYSSEVLEEDHYYPFGLTLNTTQMQTGLNPQPYKLSTKEQECTFGVNLYDFGARMQDMQLGRWNGVDALSEKFYYESPYSYSGNNPVHNIDIGGLLKTSYNEETLRQQGFTESNINTFKTVVRNVGNMLVNNPQALETLSKTTGFSTDRILSDFASGQGPVINLLGSGGSGGGLNIDANYFKYLSTLDPVKNASEYNTQLLGIGLSILHEYAHYGDKVTNGGNNTGQFEFNIIDNGNSIKRYNKSYVEIFGGNNLTMGSQFYKLSPTGHRGNDIEAIGFGVTSSDVMQGPNKGEILVEPYPNYLPTVNSDHLPPIPTQLPDNVKGNNIRTTLGTK